MSEALLTFEGVTAGYGPVTVLHELSFSVAEGSIVALLGANGAGKSTTLRAISGVVKPSAGSIRFDGVEIGSRRPSEIVGVGLAHVPEGRKIFPELTVEDNLRIGSYRLADRRRTAALMEEVMNAFPRLRERRKQRGATLSGGEQQMLAFGRALMSAPRMLLLDEPSLGLAPRVVAEVMQHIRAFRDRGLTVLVVEQNAQMALALADHAYVVELGRIVSEGAGRALLDDPAVRRAYLGTDQVEVGHGSG